MIRMHGIYTLQDAIRERQQQDAAMNARMDKLDAKRRLQESEDRRIAAILRERPEIGELCRRGKRLFYVIINDKVIENADPALLPTR